LKHSFDDLKWHIIYEGSGSLAGNNWFEEVAYIGNEKWLLRSIEDPAWPSFEPQEPIGPDEKTSAELVSWVKWIDSTDPADSIEKPRQKALYEVAKNIGVTRCADLLQQLLNEKFEEKLVIVLGPPPDEWQKELFDKYQQSKKSGKPHSDGDWESYEQGIVEKLFEHEGNKPSAIDELFGKALDSKIKITDHCFSMGMNRGLWVANITIARSNVLRKPGSNITWPPAKEINSLVSDALGYLLKRNWVAMFSIYP
jgi:hypothetical protein